MNIYKVKNEPLYVVHIAEYTNGIETSAGFFTKDQLEEVLIPIVGITYDAEHATELPINWPEFYVLDDRNKRYKLKEIDFGSEDPYVMEDGYRSKEVTI